MPPPSLDLVLWIIFIGVVLAFSNWFWRRDARRTIMAWCVANSVDLDGSTFEFKMGVPARVSAVGRQEDKCYLFVFHVYSGLFSLPRSVFQVWGKVVLRERTLIE